jgi:hypothetical protein
VAFTLRCGGVRASTSGSSFSSDSLIFLCVYVWQLIVGFFSAFIYLS